MREHYGDEEDKEEEEEVFTLAKDKEWVLANKDSFKSICLKVEEELDNSKAKKPKGGANKKQKERTTQLTQKLNHVKKLKEQFDELNNQIEFMEMGHIKNLKVAVNNYFKSSDEDPPTQQVEEEIKKVLEILDNNKKAIT